MLIETTEWTLFWFCLNSGSTSRNHSEQCADQPPAAMGAAPKSIKGYFKETFETARQFLITIFFQFQVTARVKLKPWCI